MANIIITTTPTIEGAVVEEYYGAIEANQVAGTGFFSDFTASFSDFFGGHSGTYRNQLDELSENVKSSLTSKAIRLGANAIVGFSIDYDSISAKSMSMFMVSARGTAVKIRFGGEKKETNDVVSPLPVNDNEAHVIQTISPLFVTNEQVQIETETRRLLPILESNSRFLKENEWSYIITHDMPRLSSALFKHYRYCLSAGFISCDKVQQNLLLYYMRAPYDVSCDTLYDKENLSVSTSFIRTLSFFDAKRILSLLKEGVELKHITDLLQADRAIYTRQDLVDMKELLTYIEHLPETGKMTEVEGGMFSKSGMRFVCQCGNKNDPEKKYCSKCGKDIKGFTEEQNDIMEKYKGRIDAIEFLMSGTE